MSEWFMQMGPHRACIEGTLIEDVDCLGRVLAQLNGKKYELVFGNKAKFKSGTHFQAYGNFYEETLEEYPLLEVEAFSELPIDWM